MESIHPGVTWPQAIGEADMGGKKINRLIGPLGVYR